jgi:hypothetical protein
MISDLASHLRAANAGGVDAVVLVSETEGFVFHLFRIHDGWMDFIVFCSFICVCVLVWFGVIGSFAVAVM